MSNRRWLERKVYNAAMREDHPPDICRQIHKQRYVSVRKWLTRLLRADIMEAVKRATEPGMRWQENAKRIADEMLDGE